MSSTGIAEVTEAEECLDETPPCEIKLSVARPVPCGADSVVRVRFACACGDVTVRFVCAEHYAYLRVGWMRCRTCPRLVPDGLSWTVV